MELTNTKGTASRGIRAQGPFKAKCPRLGAERGDTLSWVPGFGRLSCSLSWGPQVPLCLSCAGPPPSALRQVVAAHSRPPLPRPSTPGTTLSQKCLWLKGSWETTPAELNEEPSLPPEELGRRRSRRAWGSRANRGPWSQ